MILFGTVDYDDIYKLIKINLHNLWLNKLIYITWLTILTFKICNDRCIANGHIEGRGGEESQHCSANDWQQISKRPLKWWQFNK